MREGGETREGGTARRAKLKLQQQRDSLGKLGADQTTEEDAFQWSLSA